MPFQANSELPEEVRTKLTPEQQTLWREVFNQAMADGASENDAARKAWVEALKQSSGEPPAQAQESLQIRETGGAIAAEPQGKKWRVRVFEHGVSQNRYPYKGRMLPLKWTPRSTEAAVQVLEGARCYVDHTPVNDEPSVRNLIGFYSGARAGAKGPEAELTILESETWAQQKLLAAWKAGRPGLLGFSIDATIQMQEADSGRALEVTGFKPLRSVDLIGQASSGGTPLAVLESQRNSGGPPDNPSSAERSKRKGATMKEAILKILESLRKAPGYVGAVKTEAEAITAELGKENADHEALLTRATEALSNAESNPENTQQVQETLQSIRGDMEKLQNDLKVSQEAQKKAESKELLTRKLQESKLPQPLKKDVLRRFEGGTPTEAEIDTEIKSVRETFAAVTPGPTALAGRGVRHVELGHDQPEKMQIAMHRMFGVTHDYQEVREGTLIRYEKGEAVDRKVPSFLGIREAFRQYMGRDITEMPAAEEMTRNIQEEFISSGFTNALGNTLHRLMLQGYEEMDYGLDLLAPNRVGVQDFRTQERVRVGYFGDLPSVDPETADYAEIAAPTDEKATYGVITFGGLVTVTRKTIINDDIGLVATVTPRLGRSARRSLAQRIFNLLINNAATTYDAVTWFHATLHGANLRTVALSAAEVEAIAAAMYAQTEKDSGKTLGIEASILVIPRGLQKTAKDLNEHQKEDAALNEALHRFGPNSERIITSPLLTDANDYYVLADQRQVPCIEVGFLQGRQEPEFFLADNPLEGLAFTGDRIRYKVRHEYEAVVTDHRGAAKNAVA